MAASVATAFSTLGDVTVRPSRTTPSLYRRLRGRPGGALLAGWLTLTASNPGARLALINLRDVTGLE